MNNGITYIIENIFISKSQKFSLRDRIIFWTAGLIIICVNKLSWKTKTTDQKTNTLKHANPNKYSGSNKNAKAIELILENNPSLIIKYALIHGSIALEEVINYSDIDTTLIINTDKLTKLKDLLIWNTIIISTYKEMLKHDILQHHGWTIINQKYYSHLDNQAIPFPILYEAKSLYFQNKEQNEIYFLHDQYKIKNFTNLVNSINAKLNKLETLTSFYIFKIFISELLLLPTVYLQFKLQKDISKKNSFEIIYQHINIQDANTIKEIEIIRTNWPKLNINNEKLSLNDLLKMQKSLRTPQEHLLWLNNTKENIQSILTNLERTIHQS